MFYLITFPIHKSWLSSSLAMPQEAMGGGGGEEKEKKALDTWIQQQKWKRLEKTGTESMTPLEITTPYWIVVKLDRRALSF